MQGSYLLGRNWYPCAHYFKSRNKFLLDVSWKVDASIYSFTMIRWQGKDHVDCTRRCFFKIKIYELVKNELPGALQSRKICYKIIPSYLQINTFVQLKTKRMISYCKGESFLICFFVWTFYVLFDEISASSWK